MPSKESILEISSTQDIIRHSLGITLTHHLDKMDGCKITNGWMKNIFFLGTFSIFWANNLPN